MWEGSEDRAGMEQRRRCKWLRSLLFGIPWGERPGSVRLGHNTDASQRQCPPSAANRPWQLLVLPGLTLRLPDDSEPDSAFCVGTGTGTGIYMTCSRLAEKVDRVLKNSPNTTFPFFSPIILNFLKMHSTLQDTFWHNVPLPRCASL